MAGALVRVVVPRLLRRAEPPGLWQRALIGLGVVALVGAGLLALLGERSPWLLALVGPGALALAIGWLAARLRPMLAIAALGLLLGVASLFVVLGVASGVERELIDAMARMHGHALIGQYGQFRVYEPVCEQLEADPRVAVASPYVFGVGAVVRVEAASEAEAAPSEGEPVVVTIKGLDPRRAARMHGAAQLFAAGELEQLLRPANPRQPPGIVLGARLARRLHVEIGDRVRVVVPERLDGEAADKLVSAPARHGEFELLGTIETGFAEFDASLVLVHLSAAQALVYGERRISGIELELVEARLATIPDTAEALATSLDADRIAAGLPPRFRADTWLERSPELQGIRQAKLVIAAVLGLIVLVASSSLVAALLVLIRGKRAQIGVLAALGARPRQVFWLFEGVGLAVGLLGAGAGLLLGGLVLLALGWVRLPLDASVFGLEHLPVALVLADMLIPSALAVLVCGLVSGPVALQAARLRPIECVR